MKLKGIIAMLMVLAMVLAGTCAMAMPVHYTDGTDTLAAVSEADGAEVSLNVQQFQLLGYDENGNYLIFADQGFYAVAPEELAGVVALLDAEAVAQLGSVEGMEPVSRGTKSGAVQAFQAAMIAFGALNGVADGNFGPGTEAAVQAFQTSLGLEPTGVADGRLQLLAISMAQPAQEIAVPMSPEEMYAAISDRTDVDMQVLYESGLLFDYDDMTGVGFITDGQELSFDVSGESDLDRYQLTARFGLLVKDREDGTVSIDPAVQVSCLCVRRPVLEEIIVKSGTKRGTAPIDDLSATLEGVNSLEEGTALLNDGMVAALAGAAEAGELKLRFSGRYNSFDVQVNREALASLSRIGDAAQRMR